MKKTKVMVIIIMFMVVAVKSYAVLVTGMETISAGDPITAEPIQNNYDQIVNVVNGQIEGCGVNMQTSSVCSSDIRDGSITNADISATAGIVDTKLAQITTAGKVSTSAITGTLPLTSHGDYSSATSTMHSASSTYVADPGSYFDSTNVEGALNELAFDISQITSSSGIRSVGYDWDATPGNVSISWATGTFSASATMYVEWGCTPENKNANSNHITLSINGSELWETGDTDWNDIKYKATSYIGAHAGQEFAVSFMAKARLSTSDLSGNSHLTVFYPENANAISLYQASTGSVVSCWMQITTF